MIQTKYIETPHGLDVLEVEGNTERVIEHLPLRNRGSVLRRIGETFELDGREYKVTRVTPYSAWAEGIVKREAMLNDVKTGEARRVTFSRGSTIQVGTYREEVAK